MDRREERSEQEINALIDQFPNDRLAQIDGIARIRRWSRPKEGSPAYATIQSYLSGQLDIDSAVEKIAEPIEEAYTTANHGRAILDAEDVAENQRQHWSAEEFEHRWGKPLPESELPVVKAEDKDKTTCEGALWVLYYSILYSAKRIPWRDETAQEKLLDLVKAIKKRPDPSEPVQMTKALRNDWIWGDNKIWSKLKMLGPSAREVYNEAPFKRNARYVEAEIEAWANLNGFWARLTRDGVHELWLYAIWGLRCLEDDIDPSEHWTEVQIPAAAVWVLVLGRKLYETEIDMTPTSPNQGNPAKGGKLWKGKTELSKERWRLWKKRFGEFVADKSFPMSTDPMKTAAEAFESMEAIEKGEA